MRALEHGVLYLDGGWQQLVDALRDVATTAGATIHSDLRVDACGTMTGIGSR